MSRDFFIFLIAAVAVGISALADPYRTWEGLRRGSRMLWNLVPQLLLLVVLVSVFIGLVPGDTLARLLGRDSGVIGVLIAAGIGSVALIPGPIAYPLSGMLLHHGVSYLVIAVFVTTLMMVGVVTFPVEQEYLGFKVALLRNVLSLAGALCIGILMGMLL